MRYELSQRCCHHINTEKFELCKFKIIRKIYNQVYILSYALYVNYVYEEKLVKIVFYCY